MREFSTVHLVEHLDEVTDAASQAPVAITESPDSRFVMMSLERFETLRREFDSRRVYGPNELPEPESTAVVAALERSIAELEARLTGQ